VSGILSLLKKNLTEQAPGIVKKTSQKARETAKSLEGIDWPKMGREPESRFLWRGKKK